MATANGMVRQRRCLLKAPGRYGGFEPAVQAPPPLVSLPLPGHSVISGTRATVGVINLMEKTGDDEVTR
jgi:hypothetical protein